MCDRIIAEVPLSNVSEAISLSNFIGQPKVVEMLRVGVESAKMRNESLGHVLLTGPRGSGKSTLATAIANDLSAGLKVISVRAIKGESDFAAILTSIEPNDVLLFENISSIKQDNIDLLCTAMEDFCLDIIIGKGPGARSIRLDIPHFTAIATLDETLELPEKLISCFTYNAKLGNYTTDELVKLAYHCAKKMDVRITNEGAKIIASAANGDYRKLFNAIKRSRDFAIVKGNGEITETIANDTLSFLTNT